MLKPALVLLAAFAATQTFVAQASAQSAKFPDQCAALNVALDDRIAGCTAIIEAKKETGRALSIAYCNRGFALTERRELDKAMADLNEAIKADGTSACSYSNRGRVWQFRGCLLYTSDAADE